MLLSVTEVQRASWSGRVVPQNYGVRAPSSCVIVSNVCLYPLDFSYPLFCLLPVPSTWIPFWIQCAWQLSDVTNQTLPPNTPESVTELSSWLPQQLWHSSRDGTASGLALPGALTAGLLEDLATFSGWFLQAAAPSYLSVTARERVQSP